MLLLRSGQRKPKHTAHAGFAFHGHFPAMAGKDALTHRQPDPCAFNFTLRLETLKDLEDPLVELRINSQAMIPNRKLPHLYSLWLINRPN